MLLDGVVDPDRDDDTLPLGERDARVDIELDSVAVPGCDADPTPEAACEASGDRVTDEKRLED